MGRVCRTHGEKKNAYGILVGKLEEKIPIGRPRRRWEDNIKMDLGNTRCGSKDWIHLDQEKQKERDH
jgi:hypothetical protein